jgi:hypothetical protein
MSETRTLKVVIAGGGKGAQGALKGTADDLGKLEGKVVSAGQGWSKFTAKMKAAGTSVKTFVKGSQSEFDKVNTRHIDAELIKVQKRIEQLSKDFAISGNKDVFKKFNSEKASLAKLSKVRKELGNINDSAEKAGKAAAGMVAKLGSITTTALENTGTMWGRIFTGLPPQAQLAIGASIVGIGVLVAPVLGASIAGAIVGGVGLGGVVGGVMIAATHPLVQAAGKQLASTFTEQMQTSGAVFVPPVIAAIGKIRDTVTSLGGDFSRIFADAARYVEPLTDGVIGFVRNLLPGVEAAIGSAGPIIDELASWGPKLGTLLSDIFTTLATQAGNGASALSVLWTVFEQGVWLIATVVYSLTVMYGLLKDIYDVWAKIFGAETETKMKTFAASGDKATGASKGLGGGLQEIINGFKGTGGAAGAAAVQVETFAAATKRITDQNLSARDAARGMETAIDAADAAFKKNGATLDINTPKGRANQAALDGIASSSNAAYDATLKQTGSQDQANAVLERGKAQFIALAGKMGLSSTAAKALADTLFAIPSPKPTVTVEQQKALTAIARIQSGLNGLHDKDITVGVWYETHGSGAGDLKLPGGHSVKGASVGGLQRGPGTGTSDSLLRRLSTGEFVVRAAAVKRLGVGFMNGLNHADSPGFRMPAGETASAGLASRSLGAPGGGVAVHVSVNVAGSVAAERDLARSIALTVRDEIARNGKRNGGRTGV